MAGWLTAVESSFSLGPAGEGHSGQERGPGERNNVLGAGAG